jgi:hypothetical protein
MQLRTAVLAWFEERSLFKLVPACLLILIPAIGRCGDYDIGAEFPLSLRALADVRFVRPGRAPSSTDRGPGKWRYGGVFAGDGSERVVRFAISQFALEPSAVLPGGIRAHLQLNWEADIDDRGNFGEQDAWPRLIEAWLRKEWGTAANGFGLQTGVINPPFSLEHTGPARTPEFTLTPSALSSWLWEDGRILGLEGEWWRAADDAGRFGVFGGLGWGPDQNGILLAQRGWILTDRLNGINTTVPLPMDDRYVHGFDERDGRPAIYVGIAAADPWHIGEARLTYFDNLGDTAVRGVWEGRFGTAGFKAEPVPGLSVLFQYLGAYTTTATGAFESEMNAWYTLLSYRYRGHRLTVRYDDFAVHDEDGPPSTRERGRAVTVAYLFELGLRHRIGFEYVWIDSERPTSTSPDPADDGWQVSYRFRY